jgi:hypothetical protein
MKYVLSVGMKANNFVEKVRIEDHDLIKSPNDQLFIRLI